jgi:hypothetical protein
LVVSAVITATELTIRWNDIQDVDNVSSAGQLIPMIIGVGQVIRILYLAIFGDVDKDRRKRVLTRNGRAMNLTAIPVKYGNSHAMNLTAIPAANNYEYAMSLTAMPSRMELHE